MGELLDEIKKKRIIKRPNRLTEICAELNKEDEQDLREAIADFTVGPTAIVRALKSRNIIVDRATIYRWREATVNEP